MSAPFSAGSYLAKFTNGGGVYSDNAAVTVAQARSASIPAGEIFDYAPFGGQYDGTIRSEAGVRLAADATGVLRETGTYQPAETIVLSGACSVRLSGDVIAQGVDVTGGKPGAPDIYGVDPNSWRVALEVSTTLSDPSSTTASWSPWSPIAASEITARGLRVRVRLTSLSDGISPVVELLHLRVDIDPRLESGLNVAIPAGGRRVTYSAPFTTEPTLIPVLRRPIGAATMQIFNRDAAGFDARLDTPDGGTTEGSLDFIASGYGRKVS